MGSWHQVCAPLAWFPPYSLVVQGAGCRAAQPAMQGHRVSCLPPALSALRRTLAAGMLAGPGSGAPALFDAAKLSHLGQKSIVALLAGVLGPARADREHCTWQVNEAQRPAAAAATTLPDARLLAAWHERGAQHAAFSWSIPNFRGQLPLQAGTDLESPPFGPGGQWLLVASNAASGGADFVDFMIRVEWRPPNRPAGSKCKAVFALSLVCAGQASLGGTLREGTFEPNLSPTRCMTNLSRE